MIFDTETGRALTGTTNQKGQRYYKPYAGIKYRYQLNADVIEQAVVDEFFEALSCKRGLSEAVFNGHPVEKIMSELEEKKLIIISEQKSIERKIAGCLKAIEIFEGPESELIIITNNVAELTKRRQNLDEEIQSIEYRVLSLPKESEIKDIMKQHRESFIRSGIPLNSLPFKEKRRVLQIFFSGHDNTGGRYGIFIKHIPGKPRRYQFEAYGRLGSVSGNIKGRCHKYHSIADNYLWHNEINELSQGVAEIILKSKPTLNCTKTKVNEHLLSERHAHYCLSLHQ
jgi:hypothetical protein